MGLFNKKEEKEKTDSSGIRDLPPLPVLPDLGEKPEELPKLPNFPKNGLGEKSSQNNIKKAINGEKKEEEGILEEDNSADEDWQMIKESPQKQSDYEETREFIDEKFSEGFQEAKRKVPSYEYSRKMLSRGIPQGFEEASKKIKETEPIFIRIDKFEESKKIFEKTKNQVEDIEKALNRIRLIKQEEDKELDYWEQEILNIKEKISKIEEDIFSKV